MTIYRKNAYYHEMRSLEGAIQRCHNPNHKSYSQYGARGITVCDEWRGRGAFQRFMEHIGPKPLSGLTLDRIKNDKGYEPGNVRWATYGEQNANRRQCRSISAAARANMSHSKRLHHYWMVIQG